MNSLDSQLFHVSHQGGPLHVSLSTKSFEFGIEEEDGVKKPRKKSSVVDTLQDTIYNWEEWKPVYQEDRSSRISIPGIVLYYRLVMEDDFDMSETIEISKVEIARVTCI